MILVARKKCILDLFHGDHPLVDENFVKIIKEAIREYAHKKLACGKDLEEIISLVTGRLAERNAETDPSTILHLENLTVGLTALDGLTQGQSTKNAIDACEDIVFEHMDKIYSEQNVLGEHLAKVYDSSNDARIWESRFMKEMKKLHVLPPSGLVRASEVIPESIAYIQQIMQNGLAYEADGSVYFDVAAFDNSPDHRYVNLCLKSADNPCLFEEGEGSLGIKLTGRRDPRDFALWKASKPGEPWWESPWGKGRPGWHVLCSAMAKCVFSGKIDIHSGGIDLAFPHHDNEIALNKAYSSQDGWVNYFLHAGNVLNKGHKMSCSLNNHVTIKDLLRRYTSRQIRMFFLLHQWNNTVVYTESALDEAVAIEKSFENFLQNLKYLQEDDLEDLEEPNATDLQLLNDLNHAQEEFDLALRDNFDTPRAIQAMRDLMVKVESDHGDTEPTHRSLKLIVEWIDKMLSMFGLELDGELEAVMGKVAEFYYSVRQDAYSGDARSKDYISSCYWFHNQLFNQHGILLKNHKYEDDEDDSEESHSDDEYENCLDEDDRKNPSLFCILDKESLAIVKQRVKDAKEEKQRMMKRRGKYPRY